MYIRNVMLHQAIRRDAAAELPAPRVRVAYTVAATGESISRKATRISFDGNGRLLIYHGRHATEAVLLGSIRDLRIDALHPTPGKPRSPEGVARFTWVFTW